MYFAKLYFTIREFPLPPTARFSVTANLAVLGGANRVMRGCRAKPAIRHTDKGEFLTNLLILARWSGNADPQHVEFGSWIMGQNPPKLGTFQHSHLSAATGANFVLCLGA
jgi:hypothetical protein